MADVLRRCPNVWAELSAREPWRFVNNPITGDDGALLPEWRDLIESFPDRFMVGSDSVRADVGSWRQYTANLKKPDKYATIAKSL